MLRYGTTGHSMVPNGVIGDLYVQFPFQQKKNLLNSYTGSASGTTFGQGGSRGGGRSCPRRWQMLWRHSKRASGSKPGLPGRALQSSKRGGTTPSKQGGMGALRSLTHPPSIPPPSQDVTKIPTERDMYGA